MIPKLTIKEISFVKDEKIVYARVNDIAVENGIIVYTLENAKYQHLKVTSMNSQIIGYEYY